MLLNFIYSDHVCGKSEENCTDLVINYLLISFVRITSFSRIWHLYFKITNCTTVATQSEKELHMQRLMKGCAMRSESWLHSAKSLKRKKKDCEFISNVGTYKINGLDLSKMFCKQTEKTFFRLFPIISISQNFFSFFFLTLEKNRNRRKSNLLP